MFYPSDPEQLFDQVRGLLGRAQIDAAEMRQPKVLVAPHAGYAYSGATAACAYAALRPWRDVIRRVVVLGPTHRVAIRGLAWPAAIAFATPLGVVPVDSQALTAIRELPQVVISGVAHALEHSIEVHLPFLQEVLAEFSLAPLAVGDARPREVAEVLERLWGGAETLIVVSSDLSHYLSYEAAQTMDRRTVAHVLALDLPLDHQEACGATPLNGLLALAAQRRLEPHLLDLRNSGDTAGDRRQVVGYAAIAFYEPEVGHA